LDRFMPLERYGVLVGTLYRSVRDQPDTQGRWYHVNLEVDAPLGRYRCAVDVDSKQSDVGVQWKVLTIPPGSIAPVAGSSAGYYDLERTADGGALDFLRHRALGDAPGCLFVRDPGPLLGWLSDLLGRRRSWTAGSNIDAAGVLEGLLVPGRRLLVFGEPFDHGLGMHNVHQNQGDPAGSQWWDENGIWQDGATLVERPDGAFDAFLSKFSTQATRTDDAGHPT
jgi:hypothetical protein